MNKICPLCKKGILTNKIIPYVVCNIKLGDFPAEICSKCGEQWFNEKTAKQIEKAEKQKGL